VVDPGVIAALQRALADKPADDGVRLHLAGLLLDQDPAGALEHAQQVLGRQPAQLEALRIAADAAARIGDRERSEGYQRLLGALSPPQQPQQPPEAERLPVGAGLENEAELDAFLSEVLRSGEEVEQPIVTLADVGGLEEVKRRLTTSFLGPMRNPEMRKMYGKSLRGGLLLYGPPGCGKTFLARAVAGELGARFFQVGLHDVLDMWLGQSERNLHTIFETARNHAPCVLFLDEVDALGLKRTNLSHSAGRNVVVQLLSELDSTRADNEGVFVLGATNQPWDLDSALRRPGRFDRMLLVLPPDPPARSAIIAYHLRDRPVGMIDTNRLAEGTDGYSGADLRLVCEAAAERALEQSLAAGTPRPIDMSDFAQALREVKPSTRPWFETARNYAMFANESGTYDDLITYMRQHKLG
jgi:SpoVK/Ycf46/Vps4 family AAA+-type ATPase